MDAMAHGLRLDLVTQRGIFIAGPYPRHRLPGQDPLVKRDERGDSRHRCLFLHAAAERAWAAAEVACHGLRRASHW